MESTPVRNVEFICPSVFGRTINAMSEKLSSNLERRPPESTTDTESCKVKEREGGYAAWLTVLGSILVYYASFGIMNSFGFFQDYYSKDFLKDTSASTIAFIGTLQMALMNLLAAISGALCDRYGVKVRTHCRVSVIHY
jgi:MCP family monocarboxylic acid transporter-like MFS transporter 10